MSYAGTGTALYDEYFHGFVSEYFGTTEDNLLEFGSFVNRKHSALNSMLRAIPSVPDIPIPLNSAGSYDVILQDLEINFVIYHKLESKNAGMFAERPYWIERYKTEYESILEQIRDGDMILSDNTSFSDTGFDKPLANSENTGSALFFTNYGNGEFTGAYPYSYKIKIIVGTLLTNSKFVVSHDNGVTYLGTYSVGTNFVSIGNGCKVRWQLTDEQGQFSIDDYWTFNAVPDGTHVIKNSRMAKSYKNKNY